MTMMVVFQLEIKLMLLSLPILTIQSGNCNKTANINVKKLHSLKKVFKGDTAYNTQLKQQKSKRCYYLGAR